MTNCTIDEPAKMAHFKFPGWTALPHFQIIAADLPTGSVGLTTFHFYGKEKQRLTFYLIRNISPSLLIALNRLEGSSKQLGHILLRFLKLLPEPVEFIFIHRSRL
jgi:hypothetical protein